MRVVTLLTDFGYRDPYVAQMKGVILGISNDIDIVDITHNIEPQNVEEGAFLLYTSVPYFPKGSIHVAVVDPGVGTDRKGLIIKCRDYLLVGPDNGILMPSAKRSGDFRVYVIEKSRYLLDNIKHTFHGRDIFAPVAGHLANGIEPEIIGREIDRYVDLKFELGKIEDSRINGKILHIDRFGNLITNITEDMVLDRIVYGETIDVEIGKKTIKIPFLKSYGYTEKGKMLLTIGGSGFLEIGKSMGSARDALRVKQGERVTLIL